MYRHILIPTDGSQLSQNAIAHGAALAKSINAQVTILTVSTPFHTFAVEPEMVSNNAAQRAGTKGTPLPDTDSPEGLGSNILSNIL